MTALDAGYAVAQVIDASVFWTLATNLFVCPEQPSGSDFPVVCVFVLATGGPPPDDFLGDASKRGIKHHRVQVIVRGAPNAFAAGLALAMAVRDLVHLATVSGAIRCACEQSEPIFLGLNDQEQPRWSINLMVDAVW